MRRLTASFAATLALCSYVACAGKSDDEPTGDYNGFYRGAPRPTTLGTPISVAPVTPIAAAGSASTGEAGSSGAGGAPSNAGGSGGGSLAGAAGSGTPSTGTGGSAPASTVCDAMTMILTPKCGASGCHGGGTFGTFALSQADAETYVDRSATNGQCLPSIIDSADTDKSLILLKVTGNQGSSCGQRMPLGGELSQTEQDCVKDWLTQFAE